MKNNITLDEVLDALSHPSKIYSPYIPLLLTKLNKRDMVLNDIKKELYKQNPMANMDFIRKGVAHYSTVIKNEDENEFVRFEVPVNDMGDADFFTNMNAKLLIRYLVV